MPSRTHLIAAIVLASSLMAFGWGIYGEEARQEAIETKTAALGNQLADYSQQLEHTADALGRQIGYYVYQNRFQARDQLVLQQAEQIIARADAMADSLGGFIVALEPTDAEPARFGPLSLANDDLARGIDSHQLQVLARHLDRYVAFIRRYAPDVRSLTLPAGSRSDSHSFSSYYFQHASESGARATLRRLIAEVRRYEMEALWTQAQKVGSGCICFSKIGAVAIPASGTVEPGSVYEAQLLLAESFSGAYYQQMSVNRHIISRFENKQGLVELPIPKTTGNYSDTTRTEWHGLIQARLFPADTTWRLTVPFLVINRPRS